MKKHSCGALLYTIYNNKIFIALGKEDGEWYPFKGVVDNDETFEETAIREVDEETCHAVVVKSIKLECKYATKRKHYHIGLILVSPTLIEHFNINRCKEVECKYLEKSEIKFFSLNDIRRKRLHRITIIPIIFYWNFLLKKQNMLNNKLKICKHGILTQYKNNTAPQSVT
jgi:8-oxo-dGTP pyrophosphatase MutT (NUDIX family)